MKGLKTTLISAIAVGLVAGSAVGVAAQEDPMAAAAVTGTTTFHEEVVGGSAAWEDDALRGRGLLFPTTWEASDPRLSGTQTIRANRDLYERLRMQVLTGTSLLENDDGRWVGTAGHLGGAKLGETSTVVMHGEDAYEGLTAYVVMDLEAQPPSFSAAIYPAMCRNSLSPSSGLTSP